MEKTDEEQENLQQGKRRNMDENRLLKYIGSGEERKTEECRN